MNQKITFTELVELLARRENCTKRDAENFLRELSNLMVDTISSGQSLRLNGLGTFKPVWVEDRASVNVQTGEPYLIPGHYKLTFTPTKAVRELINEPFACFSVELLDDDAPILENPEIADEKGDADSDEPIVDEQDVTDAPQELPAEQPLDEIAEEEAENVDEIEPEAVASGEAENKVEPVQESVEEMSIRVEPVDEQEEEKSHNIPDETTISPETENTQAINTIGDLEECEDAYKRGLWKGVGITTTIFAFVALLLYIGMTYIDWGAMIPVGETTDRVEARVEAVDTVAVPLTPIAPQDSVEQETTAVESPMPATTVAATATPSSEVVKETVRSGVFLTTLSLRHYGHKAFWVYIYEENKGIIANPDNIPIGTELVIPPASKYGIDASDTTAINRALATADAIKSQMK